MSSNNLEPNIPPDDDDIIGLSPLDWEGLAAHPHDHFFKRVFQVPERAREFFQAHLPLEMQEEIRWQTLQCQPTSFIHTDLKDSASDLLFSVSSGEREILLYLLWEHQSTVVPHMPLRLLSYMVKIWEKHLQTHGLPLPVVLPFVLHQGPEKWTVDTQFSSLFALPDAAKSMWAQHLPDFTHLLTDLSQRNLPEEPLNPILQAILYLMQSVRQRRQLLEFFEWLGSHDDILVLLPTDLEKLLLLYALHGEERLDPVEIYHKLQHNKRLQSDTMSIAQKLINQGLQTGLEKGLEKGRHEGLAEKVQLLQRFLGVQPTPLAELLKLGMPELQIQFEGLEETYNLKFKDR